MADLFNKYLSDIGENLAGKIKSFNFNTHKHYFDKSVSELSFLNPTASTEIYNVINKYSLKNTKINRI